MPRSIPPDIAEKLVTAVQMRECLYNNRHPGYKNRHTQELAWQEVANETQRNVTYCKSTWSSLRTTFNRNLANVKNLPNGSLAVKRPKWYLFPRLLFLQEHVSNGQTTSGLDTQTLDIKCETSPVSSRRSSSCSPNSSLDSQSSVTLHLDCKDVLAISSLEEDSGAPITSTPALVAEPAQNSPNFSTQNADTFSNSNTITIAAALPSAGKSHTGFTGYNEVPMITSSSTLSVDPTQNSPSFSTPNADTYNNSKAITITAALPSAGTSHKGMTGYSKVPMNTPAFAFLLDRTQNSPSFSSQNAGTFSNSTATAALPSSEKKHKGMTGYTRTSTPALFVDPIRNSLNFPTENAGTFNNCMTTAALSSAGKKHKGITDPVQQAVVDFIMKKLKPEETEEDADLTLFRGLLPYFKSLSHVKKLQFIHHMTGHLVELLSEDEQHQ